MTPQERAAAIIGGHYECEDPWYSCPLSPDGCANANMGKECTCGYDDRKQNVERLIAETRRAALLEINRRLLPNAQSAMLDAPCLWCGYNGEGYWQPTTHELTCPWHNVGGRFDRVVALDRLAQEG